MLYTKYLPFLLVALTLICCLTLKVKGSSGTVEFETCTASSDASTFKDLKFVSRVYVPYGVDLTEENSSSYGYGYGMGAAEKGAYDASTKYFYAMSEQGYVTVVDLIDPTAPQVLPEEYMIDLGGETLTDVKVCAEKQYLLVSRLTNGAGQPGDVLIYSTIQRKSEVSVAEKDISPMNIAVLIATVPVGAHPDMLLPNADCSLVGVANEAEGTYDTELVDAIGSTSLIDMTSDKFEVKTIMFDMWSDNELIDMGVHLPLPLNGLIYWDQYSLLANDLDFTSATENYNSGTNLEPEYLAWSADGKKLYVNLQENSALVTIDVESASVVAIDAYGLKSWSETPIDIFADGGCTVIKPVPGLYSGLMADSIEAVQVDGKLYIITANEGDDKEYGDFEEKVKAEDLFSGGVFNGTVPSYDCEASAESNALCTGSLRVTVGSASVDYTNVTWPMIKRIVAFGGRGISIFKVPEDPETGSLQLVWDSADDFEQETCANVPWAHNSIQDEEFSPIYGVLYNTTDDEDLRATIAEVNDPLVDGCEDQGDGSPGACPLSKTVDERSERDGPAPEAVAVGRACGRLMLLTASEKGGTALLYDITDIESPQVLKVFHLSPASENKSAGLAYEDGDLGDVDSETVIFLDAESSPSGKASILFVGAWSGTVSYYEFECSEGYVEPTAEEFAQMCGENDATTNSESTTNSMTESNPSTQATESTSSASRSFVMMSLAISVLMNGFFTLLVQTF